MTTLLVAGSGTSINFDVDDCTNLPLIKFFVSSSCSNWWEVIYPRFAFAMVDLIKSDDLVVLDRHLEEILSINGADGGEGIRMLGCGVRKQPRFLSRSQTSEDTEELWICRNHEAQKIILQCYAPAIAKMRGLRIMHLLHLFLPE